MKLSPNFSLSEFTRSDAAVRLKNSNQPDTDQQLQNLKKLAETMEQVRALFGVPITVSSGYRNAVVNEEVGGVPNSDHAQGLACDFSVKGVDKGDACRRIRESGIKYDQLIDEPTWIHLGVGTRMRQQNLIARRNKAGKMVYTPA